MSTAIFFGFPGHGHVIPSLPIVAELARRGERIHYYLTPEFKNVVSASGVEFRAYGAAFPLASPYTLAQMQRGTTQTIRAQLESSAWVLENLSSEIQTLHPAYILHDSLAAWGWYVARALHLPSIALFPTLLYNFTKHDAPRALPLSARVRRAMRRLYQIPARIKADALSRKYHIPRLENLAQLARNRGDLNLVITSREFQPDGASFDPARFQFIGPSLAPRADAPAFPFAQLDKRPLLLISLGTAFNQRPAFYAACLRAFANTRFQVVMAVGEHFAQLKKNDAPPNFIVRASVPQLELLPRTSVFVSHGGMNSVHEALYFNVPLVMIPQGGDHAWIASRVVELGAGVMLASREPEPRQLWNAVEKIFSEPKYRDAAARIGATLRATGGAVQAADAIFNFKASRVIA